MTETALKVEAVKKGDTGGLCFCGFPGFSLQDGGNAKGGGISASVPAGLFRKGFGKGGGEHRGGSGRRFYVGTPSVSVSKQPVLK